MINVVQCCRKVSSTMVNLIPTPFRVYESNDVPNCKIVNQRNKYYVQINNKV